MKILSIDKNQQQKFSTIKKSYQNNKRIVLNSINQDETFNNLTFKGIFKKASPSKNFDPGNIGCLTVLAIMSALMAGIAACFAGIIASLYMLDSLHDDTKDNKNCECCQHKMHNEKPDSISKSTIQCQPKNIEQHKICSDNIENNLCRSNPAKEDNKLDTLGISEENQTNIKLSREEKIAQLENRLYSKNKELAIKMNEFEKLKDNSTARMVGATTLGLIPAILVLPPGPHTPLTLLAALISGVPLVGSVGGTYMYNNSKEKKYYNSQILPIEQEIKEIKTELYIMQKP